MGRGSLLKRIRACAKDPNLWLMVFRFHPPYNEGTVEFLSPDTLKKGGRTLEPEIPVSR